MRDRNPNFGDSLLAKFNNYGSYSIRLKLAVRFGNANCVLLLLDRNTHTHKKIREACSCTAVLLVSKSTKMFFGCFDLENDFLNDENN